MSSSASASSTSPPSRAGLTQRTVCAAIPVDRKTDKVLMITSRKHHTKWIFPKGGHEQETGESLAEAAIRESWEEAGTPKNITGESIGPEVYAGSSRSGDGERRIDYHVFEIEVDADKLCVDWPEGNERLREWVSVPDVLARCKAWSNEKNNKLDLYFGFQRTKVHQRYIDNLGKNITKPSELKVGVGTGSNGSAVEASRDEAADRSEIKNSSIAAEMGAVI